MIRLGARAVCCWGAWIQASSGCLLVGYDREHGASAHDAGPPFVSLEGDGGDSSQGVNSRDAGPARDAAAALDAEGDGAPRPDAAGVAADASLDVSAADASNAADSAAVDAGGACPGGLNACSGCAVLANAVGSSCGMCGLGVYLCSGTDAVSCSGGARLPVASGGPILIDDLEDGDRSVKGTADLSGDWYTVTDSTRGTLNPPTGTAIVPVSPGASGSAQAIHVSGSGFTKWGAGVAVSLNARSCSYDAAAERGFSFYVKGTGNLVASAATRPTVPTANGGTCSSNCNDHFNMVVPLTNAWTLHTVPWTSLAQTGWGTKAVFAASELMLLQFSFGPNVSFDLYVDTVSFY